MAAKNSGTIAMTARPISINHYRQLRMTKHPNL